MAMRQKILLIDDEKDTVFVLRGALERENFAVVTADSAEQALAVAVEARPDLILCDVNMPYGDGVSLCQLFRKDQRTADMPIILMSGVHKGEADQVEGIARGADDYLPKPFSPGLLIAKVHAVLRRRSSTAIFESVIKTDGLTLDLQARTAAINGRSLPLTRKEFDLLTTFIQKPGRVMSTAHLLEAVWGYDPADERDHHTVGVHIFSLRKKLGPRFAKKIVSVPGIGYRFDP